MRVDKIELQNQVLKDQLTKLQIGLAEKIGPGAIAGAVSTMLILALKFLAGV